MNDEDNRRHSASVRTCMEAHEGQVRRYTNEPYWVHPVAVGNNLTFAGVVDVDIIIAAHLHDVVEDTDMTIEQVTEGFGQRVGTLVGWLTDVSVPEDGNRVVRKKIDREHLAAAPWEAQMIKLADLINNTRSIVAHDPKFAKVYMREVSLLLSVLTKGAHNVSFCRLYEELEEVVAEYFAKQLEVGHRLPTRDGRVFGNVTVVSLSEDVVELVTDFGNVIKLSYEDVYETFYPALEVTGDPLFDHTTPLIDTIAASYELKGDMLVRLGGEKY